MAKTSLIIQRWLAALCERIFVQTDSDEDCIRKRLMYGVSSIGVVFLVILGIVAVVQGGTVLAILDFSVASLLVVLLVLLGIKGYQDFCIKAGVVLMTILYLYLFVSGGITGTAFLWSYTYPLFTCFLLGSRKGFWLSFGYFLFCCIFMVIDFYSPTINIYSLNLSLRFLPSFAVVLLFSVLYEKYRENSYNALIATRNNLELIVQERTSELVREVQHRKEKESELRISEARYRSLYDNSGDGISIISRTGRIISVNKQIYARLGYTEEEIKEKRPEDLYDEKSQKPLKAMFEKVFATGSADLEATQVSRSGEKIPVEIRAQLTVVDNEDTILCTCRDITERKLREEENKNLQERLHRASTMEAIGLMAGGIAHDLNNILAGITGYPELMLLKLPPDSALVKPLQAVLHSGRRAAAVVTELLTMARGVASVKKNCDCNRLIEEFLTTPEVIKITEDYSGVELVTQLGENTGSTICSTIHIEKCIMNLLMNAVEAVDGQEGARVEIITDRPKLSDEFLESLNLSSGTYVRITVNDNGSGISGEDVEKIFEPFYSKKILGRSGTGLGLTVVWNVVHEHHGTVSVHSNEFGTSFTLYLPGADKSEQKKIEDFTSWDMLPAQSILVVDDDPQLRDIGKAMFETFGHVVKTVSSGEEALVAMQNETFDLMLIDMMMEPGLNGRQTYEEVIKINPRQKALIASGYSENTEVKRAIALGASGFIKKPYGLQELFRAVKNIE